MENEKLQRGYIRIFREIDRWEWYTEVNTFKLFFHCLISANHTTKEWRGIEIKRGSFITSTEKLSVETGLSIQQVRTALKNLEKTGEITRKTTSRNTTIIVNKYNDYQILNKQTNKQPTNEQQTDNKQITTTNNDNNELIMINNELIINQEKNKKIKDPFYSKEIKKFLSEFKKRTNRATALNSEERNCLMTTLNDLFEQGYELSNIIDTLCNNFNSIDFDLTTFTPSINWLLEDNAKQFYRTLNGQHNKKLTSREAVIKELEEKERKENQAKGWS